MIFSVCSIVFCACVYTNRIGTRGAGGAGANEPLGIYRSTSLSHQSKHAHQPKETEQEVGQETEQTEQTEHLTSVTLLVTLLL